MKKLVLTLVVGSMMMAQPVSAASTAELQAQINALMQILQQLIVQVAALSTSPVIAPVQPQPPVVTPPIVDPPVYCPAVYKPVCGQPAGCSACPPGAYCAKLCAEPQPVTYSNRCKLDGARATYLYEGECKTNTTVNSAPVIDAIEGPTSLLVGEKAKWSIKAHDVDGDKLTYKVRWGDERWLWNVSPWSKALPWYGGSQEAGFEHTYRVAGRYTISVSVSDGQGHTTNSYITVFVRAPSRGNMTCITGGQSYDEGDSVRCLDGADNTVRCIADASFVCRSGEWEVEGGLPATSNKTR